MSRRALVLVAVTATVLTVAGAAVAAPAPQTVGPVVAGWWSAANQDPALPAVSPPDVGPRDLHVAGANAGAGGLPLPGAGGPTALAALRFTLPTGAVAGRLQLHLTGVEPPAVTLTACRATRSFEAAQGGAWADAPTYDCADAGTARLEPDGNVVIDGVDALRDGTDLSLVLVPGPLDRVVVAAPEDGALTVSGSSSARAGVPAGAPLPPAAPMPSSLSGTAPLAGGAAPLPAGALPGVTLPSAPSTAAAALPPVVAAPLPAASAVEVAARPLAALLGTLLLALLAFVLMLRDRGGSPASGTAGVRGVGRFRSERSGQALDLG